jgi:hypothetical protein
MDNDEWEDEDEDKDEDYDENDEEDDYGIRENPLPFSIIRRYAFKLEVDANPFDPCPGMFTLPLACLHIDHQHTRNQI